MAFFCLILRNIEDSPPPFLSSKQTVSTPSPVGIGDTRMLKASDNKTVASVLLMCH